MQQPDRFAAPFLAGPALLAGVALLGGLAGCGSDGGSTASPASSASSASSTSAQHLDVDAFATLTQADGVTVLDVRAPGEYAAGHLPGSVNLDVNGDFDAGLAKLPKTTSYAVYCRSGHRSGIALGRMTAAGFTHVADLAGGITAWSATGRPVVAS